MRKKSSKSIYCIVFIIGFFTSSFATNLILGNHDDGIHISIVYSSEKASWMSIAYSDFMSQWEENHPDQNIQIEMHPYGSSDSVISILNGEIFPTIWSPASSIWIPFLNTKWNELYPNMNSIANLSESVKIIYSPIVIATWEHFNNSHPINGFQDLHDLCIDPELNLKMAHTDPRLSNSGFMGTIMALSAASGVPSKDFTLEDLNNEDNQNWLREFESSAVMYGKSTGFLARYMRDSGPDALQVTLLYENLIKDISSFGTDGKIIAVYPEEGTLYSDHPFCILDADWITEDQRMVANEFLSYLSDYETVVGAMQYGFRPINSSITLDPTVFNYETNGIAYELKVPELITPENGDVLLKIPDLWLLSKATV